MVTSIINITAPTDTVDGQQLRTYQACVNFMAHWITHRQVDTKLDAVELFDEFKANVCAVMADGVEGTG